MAHDAAAINALQDPFSEVADALRTGEDQCAEAFVWLAAGSPLDRD